MVKIRLVLASKPSAVMACCIWPSRASAAKTDQRLRLIGTAFTPRPHGRATDDGEMGDRQRRILEALTHGPHSINALIDRLDPQRPSLVHASLKRLLSRQLVEVTGRCGKHDLSAMVALAALDRTSM